MRPPPWLETAPAEVRRDFLAQAAHWRLDSGSTAMRPGAACAAVAFLTTGRLRVYQVGEDGREVTLYWIERHECCVLTVACLLGGQPFPALAQAETDAEGWAVTAPIFRAWVNRHQFWRDYVFGLLGRRLGEVLRRIEDVTFRRVDARIVEALLRRAGPAGRFVTVTQQQLADEVGSAREVVSRTLTRLGRERLLRVKRGRVELLQRDVLGRVARRG
ncbi:MAG: Crp/Fnr family transcriptional regulator [Verrucomicrobia bacterium]|nr:Crp/Fnr family transcriptional regulator [Verrucomicrobiota bacterium]